MSTRESRCKVQGRGPLINSFRLPLRVAIELLSSRVDQLCHFIRDNGFQPPPMSEEKDSTLTRILKILGLAEVNSTLTQHVAGSRRPSLATNEAESHSQGSSPVPITAAATDQSEGTELQPSEPSPKPGSVEEAPSKSTAHNQASTAPLPEHQDAEDNSPGNILGAWDWDIGLGELPNSSEVQHFFGSASPSGTLAEIEDVPEAFSPVLSGNNTLVEENNHTEDIEGLIDELSNRVGTLRIGPGGQTHFCGPTSNFNLADMPVSETMEVHRNVHNDVSRCLDQLGTSAEIPASLEDHLINLYFSWQDPFVHVVNRRVYEEAKAKWLGMGDTPFYSEALRNAM